MNITVRVLGPADASVLERVAPGVFDNEVNREFTAEFVADDRHHLVVAVDSDLVDGDLVVGMASAVHYVHPDKAPQLFINEVAVAPTYQGLGIGRRLMKCIMRLTEDLGCTEAWVLTDRGNETARRLYESAGGILPAEDCIMYTIPVGTTPRTPT